MGQPDNGVYQTLREEITEVHTRMEGGKPLQQTTDPVTLLRLQIIYSHLFIYFHTYYSSETLSTLWLDKEPLVILNPWNPNILSVYVTLSSRLLLLTLSVTYPLSFATFPLYNKYSSYTFSRVGVSSGLTMGDFWGSDMVFLGESRSKSISV